jgi:integrase
MGHSTVGITADLYQHVMTDMKKEAAEKVRGIIFNKKDGENDS